MTILSGVPPYELMKQIFMDEWEMELDRDDFEWVMSLDIMEGEIPNDVQNRLKRVFAVNTLEEAALRYEEIIAFFGEDHDDEVSDYEEVA